VAALGIGTKDSAANNANDETLALACRLPEIRRLFIRQGTFTRAGLAKLAALTIPQSLACHSPKVEPATLAARGNWPAGTPPVFQSGAHAGPRHGRLAHRQGQ